MPADPGAGPRCVRTEIVGGDALGRGNEPALCWWLPDGSSVQQAYRLRTDDGFDTGRVDSQAQSYVRLPVFDRSPPVRRVQEIRPVAVRPVRGGTAFVVDFGQNFSGWVRLACPGPAGRRLTLSHGEWLDGEGDLTTEHLDVDLPIIAEPLPLGQVDEVISAGDGDVFEPRFTTHGFRYVRVESHLGPLRPDDVTGVVVHSDLRRLGWFRCSDDRHVSPYGPIEVSWRLGAGPAELDVLVPPGTTATVILPGGTPRHASPGRHRWTGPAPAA